MANDPEHLIVTLSGSQPATTVAEALQQRGFRIHSVLDAIGVITGNGDNARLSDLQATPGVADVSPNHVVGIGPPDSKDVW